MVHGLISLLAIGYPINSPVSLYVMLRGAPVSGASSRPEASSTPMWRFPSHRPSIPGDFYAMRNISDGEKRRIYDEWIASGKPHNLVCSQCRNPDNLLPCETCCRSYHVACLPPADLSVSNRSFHCPSCKQNQWDQSPPQFDNTPSSNVSRSSTPSVNSSARMASPRNGDKSYTPLGPAVIGTQSLPARPAPNMESERYHQLSDVTAPHQSDLVARARNFLLEYGHFPPSQEFRPGLLLHLGTMMAEAESYHSVQQELQQLKDENSSLRYSNANLRACFPSNQPSQLPMVHFPPSHLPPIRPGPSGVTSEKSWDRIVTDLF